MMDLERGQTGGRTIGIACLGFSMLLLPALLRGQECTPLEVPAPQPGPEKCGLLSLGCKLSQREAIDAARTFTTPMKFGTSGSEDEQLSEASYQVTGCAGAVVAPEIATENISRVELMLFSPSGAMLGFGSRSARSGGAIRFDAVDLPQSGRYTVGIRTWAGAKSYETCVKSEKGKGRLGSILTNCVQKERKSGYPRTYAIHWRGSAGLRALEIGEEWRPVVDGVIPVSRRVHLDANQGGTVRVEAASRVPLLARVSVARGGVVSEQRVPGGTGTLLLAKKPDEQFLVVRFALENSVATPVALLVTVDSAGVTPRAANVGSSGTAGAAAFSSGRRPLATGATESARIWSGDGSAGAVWEFAGNKGADYVLQIIPSGRAGLEMRATIYNAVTEEVLAQRDRISRRAELRLHLPATGTYVIELYATEIKTPDPDGGALYTLELQRRSE